MDRIELYYEVAATCYMIFTTLFMAYCFAVWIRPFMPDGSRTWISGGVYAGTMLFFDWVPFYINGMLVYGIALFLAFFVMIRQDRGCIAQKLFLAVTFFCVRWQSWRIVSCVSNEVYLLTEHLFSAENDMFWFRVYAVRSVAEAEIGCLLMYGAVKCLHWSYGCSREEMEAKEFLLLVMPSVLGLFAYGVYRYYNYVYERDSGKSPFDLYGSYDLMILFYSVVCFVTIFVMTYVFRQWKNEKEEEKQGEILSKQMQDMKSHIAEVERLYRDMRSLRHDIGNHMMTLEQLYGQGEYEEAGEYAKALKKQLQEVSPDVASGNPVTDVILSGRKKEMEEKGILFDCDFHYPKSEAVNAFDISIILNNALANAVEAVERERKGNAGKTVRVWLCSYRMKNMYIIEVANSYTGKLKLNASDGLPVTVKSGDGHGFGLANIRRVVQKYYGDIETGKEMYKKEECFVLRVMIQITAE